jgi:3-oxoacyl-[acyl-carrier-protein] synthase-3
MDLAHQLLLTGRHRNALVIGGDVCAKHFDLRIDPKTLAPAQQVNGVLFGDGAGAAVLSTRPADGDACIRYVFTRLVGLGQAPGQIVDWFGLADRDSDRPTVIEDYKAIEQRVPELAAEILDELLDTLDWKRDELNLLLPPQLSGRMTERIVERLAVLSATEISCVAETGNTGNALPFLQLERALPQMTEGDRTAVIAVESSKWIKAGIALEKV